jgi:homoserine dehydrogenase
MEKSSDSFGIALVGCGVVGGGVARLLLEQRERLSNRARRPLSLRRIVVRDSAKPRGSGIPLGLVTSRLAEVLNDPDVHVGVELIGGVGAAREAVLQLLSAGKSVVTANKALLAEHGPEIFAAARRHGQAVAFEASVAGGIPIIATLSQSLSANQITSLQGILNGTCNYILTKMSDEGRAYQEALAEAQALGYAEADPSLDVDGTDAAQKLAILAHIAFGVTVSPSAIEHRGISALQAIDLQYAKELGYTIKLVAEAWLYQGSGVRNQESGVRGQGSGGTGLLTPDSCLLTPELALHVSPVLFRHQALLAQVRGAHNAILLHGDILGETLYYGPGAGQMPTASAVVADIIDLAVGRAQLTFQAARLWMPVAESSKPQPLELRPTAKVRTRFYLRVLVRDRPGVLAEIARELAVHDISISSVMQHEALEEHEGGVVPLVIMTHTATTGKFLSALQAINAFDGVAAPCVYYPVAD